MVREFNAVSVLIAQLISKLQKAAEDEVIFILSALDQSPVNVAFFIDCEPGQGLDRYFSLTWRTFFQGVYEDFEVIAGQSRQAHILFTYLIGSSGQLVEPFLGQGVKRPEGIYLHMRGQVFREVSDTGANDSGVNRKMMDERME
ncbi:Unknown protein sequence [Pseudomonas amygdali pv. lachrymans]|uniref:Uncharacterized protein n=1 Tax=Pseudomonas amygdali pv. lachrymans TaxID=53707 RepID=A0ABR5KQ99_PSEAV|nr:Unknown protein sequence [Pseudomonas amygdali pv. lachrymans]KPC17960.1 Unknown protein sequence [Pseudomonas amygdali pv. lachrymans]